MRTAGKRCTAIFSNGCRAVFPQAYKKGTDRSGPFLLILPVLDLNDPDGAVLHIEVGNAGVGMGLGEGHPLAGVLVIAGHIGGHPVSPSAHGNGSAAAPGAVGNAPQFCQSYDAGHPTIADSQLNISTIGRGKTSNKLLRTLVVITILHLQAIQTNINQQ